MDRFKTNLVPVVAIVLLAALVVIFRSFFMNYIIQPIALLFWVAWRLLASVDQSLYWMILLAACLILVIRLIPKESPDTFKVTYSYRPPNRVEHWKALITDARLGDEEREALRGSLKTLYMSARPQIDASDAKGLEEMISTTESSLSREARQYLFPPEPSGRMVAVMQRLRSLSFFPKGLRRWAGRFIKWDTAALEEILAQIESELEIPHAK
jgi:hypothetical protein